MFYKLQIFGSDDEGKVMKRSKKSLFNAMLVGFLSASMVLTTPVYALTVKTDQTINKDITNGLQVSRESTVTINGNVSDKDVDMSVDEDDRGDGVAVTDSSKVTVNGNVDTTRVFVREEGSSLTVNGNVKADGMKADENTTITVKGDVNALLGNLGGDVTITGSVNAQIKPEDDGVVYDNGVIITGGTTVINKDINIDTPADGAAVSVFDRYNKDDKIDDINVNIGGNVNMNGSGSTFVTEGDGWDDENDKECDLIEFYNPIGLGVLTRNDSNVNVNVAGKVEVTSNGTATGILVNKKNERNNSKINITTGSVSAIGNKKLDPTQDGELLDSESNGIFVGSYGDDTSDVNILIKGDLTSEYGVGVVNDGSDDAKATTNIVVDGTIKTTESSLYIINRNKNDNTVNLTAWKIESGTENNVAVAKFEKEIVDEETGRFHNKRVLDKEATKEQAANINYIIRHDGTISLEGTRLVSVNGNDFQTARETEKLTIHVKVDDEKKYRVDRVEGGTATATKNADGSWTLIVPKNGGVDIRAVLVAIEQTKHNSGSSGGGSSSSRPGVNNASTGMMTTTPEGATVQTNVTKNDNSSVTTASVRIGTATANVTSSVSDQNGTKVTLQNAAGSLAGASFKGVGQISADGATLVKEDGTTAKMATGMLLAIENADGTSVGCFVDEMGKTIATGAFEVYYMLGTDGKLHAHFVNPQGYFLTGIQVINGQTVTFNAAGEMVSVL